MRYLIALSLVPLLIIAAEFVARQWIRRWTGYYVFAPGLRLRLEPDREALPQLEATTTFEVNSDGERGGEVPRNDAGLYRVLVAGGSQPEGYLLDQDTTWPGALQRILARTPNLARLDASSVHVGCVGLSGVGSEALALILSRLLPRYPRLQAIVLLVGASDVLRWIEAGALPSPAPPVKASDVFGCHPEVSFHWRLKRSALFETMRRLRRRWLRPVEVHTHAGRWIGEARAMRARAQVVHTSMPPAAPMLDHFERCFSQTLKLATAHADRVIVIRQPWFEIGAQTQETAHIWNGGVGRAWKEDVTAFYSLDVLGRLMALIDARTASVAGRFGVEQIGLMPLLESTLANYYDFFHLTPAGAAVVAETVAATVLHESAAPVSPATAFDDMTATVSQRGVS